MKLNYKMIIECEFIIIKFVVYMFERMYVNYNLNLIEYFDYLYKTTILSGLIFIAIIDFHL